MTPKKYLAMALLCPPLAVILLVAPLLTAQEKAALPAPNAADVASLDSSAKAARNFNGAADKALAAMQKRAEELDIKGVAVVAYAEGDTVKAWSSKMVVVGNLTTAPGPNQKGNNLLGIAYTKVAEMADTLKDSGSKVRPPMIGEYGYQGGLVIKVQTGIIMAAFSGGPSEDDLKVSHAGVEVMVDNL